MLVLRLTEDRRLSQPEMTMMTAKHVVSNMVLSEHNYQTMESQEQLLKQQVPHAF